MRPSWNQYYMDIAITTAERSSCYSEAKGAVIINKLGSIIATGYSGAPKGVRNCKYDNKYCRKRRLGYGHGEGHNECKAVHAEANAILSAAKSGISTNGCTIYCTHKPCEECTKLIINAGIKQVYYKEEYNSKLAKLLAEESGLEIVKLTCLGGNNNVDKRADVGIIENQQTSCIESNNGVI